MSKKGKVANKNGGKTANNLKTHAINEANELSEAPTKIFVMRGFVFYSFDLQLNSWTRLADMKRDRGYFNVVLIDNEIYVVGTYSLIAAGTLEKYNASANQWEMLPSMPRKLRSVGAVAFKGDLYIIGGVDDFSNDQQEAVNTIHRLDKMSGEWEQMKISLLQPRFRHAAIEYKGKLWVAGGTLLVNGAHSVTNTVEVYSEETGAFVPGPTMVSRREFIHLFVVQGDLYAVGGDVDDAGEKTVRTIEVLDETASSGDKDDLSTMSWKHVANFPNNRVGFCACATGSKIYVFAGDNRETDAHDQYDAFCSWDAFDVGTHAWESSAVSEKHRKMPLIENWGQAIALSEKHTSGAIASLPPVSANFAFEGSVDNYDAVGGMKKSVSELWLKDEAVPVTKRMKATSAMIYVMRGFVFYSFDVQLKTWTRLADLKRDRGHFQALVLNNEIYAIGTYSLIAAGTLEKYSFASNQWTLLTSMPQKLRSVGAVTYMGELYIIGGVDDFTHADGPQAVDVVHRLDRETGTWVESEAPPLHRPRFRHAAVEYKDKIWVAGGSHISNGATIATNTVEVFSKEPGRWEQGPAMIKRREFLDLLIVLGSLYAVGGDVDSHGEPCIRSIERLSADEKRWEHIADFPTKRVGFSVCATGSKIYVFAGDNRETDAHDQYDAFCSWDAFDVGTHAWESSAVSEKHRKMPLIENWGQSVAITEGH